MGGGTGRLGSSTSNFLEKKSQVLHSNILTVSDTPIGQQAMWPVPFPYLAHPFSIFGDGVIPLAYHYVFSQALESHMVIEVRAHGSSHVESLRIAHLSKM